MESEYTEEEAEQMILRVIALSDEKILELLRHIDIRFPDLSDSDMVYNIRHDPDMYQSILAEASKEQLMQKLRELESM